MHLRFMFPYLLQVDGMIKEVFGTDKKSHFKVNFKYSHGKGYAATEDAYVEHFIYIYITYKITIGVLMKMLAFKRRCSIAYAQFSLVALLPPLVLLLSLLLLLL